MTLFFIIMIGASLGVFLNRFIRGGGIPINIPIPFTNSKISGRHVNALFYALLLGVAGHVVSQQGGFVASYKITGFNFSVALLGFFAMAFGQSFGWGGSIDLLVDKPRSAGEVPQLDYITSYLETGRMYLEAGFLWFALRGVLWTFPLGLVQHSVILALSGVLMGAAYGVCIVFLGKDKGWPLSEMVWGAILWSFIFVTL